MRLKQEKFYKQCVLKGKEYAVECMGEPWEVDGILFYINRIMNGIGWIVTVGKIGMSIGTIYNSRKGAIDALPSLAKEVKTSIKKAPNVIDVLGARLEKLEKITEEDYKKLLR